jgi:raffinose/stachyose/melibiose transport system substrate-binding protein
MSDEDVVTVPWNFTVFPSLNFKNDFGSALLQYAQGTLSWDGVKDVVVNSWREEAGQ